MTALQRRFSLTALTVLELSPPDMVSAAAAAGYQHVGLRLIPATPTEQSWPVIGDTPMVREIRHRLADGGISVLDIEVFRLKPETNVNDFLPVIETAALLGARCLLTTGQDGDLSRLSEKFSAFCALAAPFGLTADLESMPWTEVNTFASAVEVLQKSGSSNAGLLVDALHFNRTRTTLEQLAQVRGEWLHFAQLCDAPAESPASLDDILYEARNSRLLPGEGGLDLVSLLRALPSHLPISVEVPNGKVGRVSAADHARQALEAAKKIVATAASTR